MSRVQRIEFLDRYKYDGYIHVFVYLNDTCNLECSYCYNHHPRSGKMIDIDQLYSFLEKLRLTSGKKIYLELIGGEPTLHLKFEQLMNHLNDDYRILIYTNFTQDAEFYAKLLNRGVRLFVLWHSKANKDFINKLEMFKTVRNQIDVSLMYEHDYEVYACQHFDKLKSMGYNVVLSLIDSDRSTYANKALKWFDDRNKNVRKEYIVTFDNGKCDLLSEEQITENFDYTVYKNWKCNAGKDYLYVHYDGQIYPCQTYLTENKNSIGHISDFDVYKLHEVICPCSHCECGFNVKKEKLVHD